MNDRRTVAFARSDDYGRSVSIIIGEQTTEYETCYRPMLTIAALTLNAVEDDMGKQHPPTLVLDREAAKGLMSTLWREGVRPDGFTDFEPRYLESLERLLKIGGGKE